LLYFPLLLTPIRRLTPIDLQGFNKLAPDAAARFGSDAPAARGFLERLAKFQVGKMIVKGQRWLQSLTLWGLIGPD
jgi:hypothetical protein